MLRIKATGQVLSRLDTLGIVADSQNYLYAHFDLPREYKGVITAHFKATINGVLSGVPITLDELNNCLVPTEIIKEPGFSVAVSSSDSGVYIVTDELTIDVATCGVPSELLPIPGATTNQYAELAGYASTCTTKASECVISAGNALTSETNAYASEDNAKLSETNANTSALNSKISETNAKTSETNAKLSETAIALVADTIEGILAGEFGINDTTPTLTEAYSGVKTEQLHNDAKTFASGLFDGISEIDLTNYYTKAEVDNIASESFINVRNFGAKGDNVTDDTIAIQSAIDYANSIGGGTVFFPHGKYRLISTHPTDSTCHLLFKQHFGIKMLGSASEQPAYDNANGTMLIANSVDKDLVKITLSFNITFNDICLDRVANATVGGNGIRFTNSYATTSCGGYNVTFKHHYNGLFADTTRMQSARWIACEFASNINNGVELIMTNDDIFQNCFVTGNGANGFKLGGTAIETASITPWLPQGTITISNCVMFANANKGVLITGTDEKAMLGIIIQGGAVDGNAGGGIAMDHAIDVRVNTNINWNTGADSDGIYIGQGSQEVVLDTCRSSDNGRNGIVIDSGASYITLSGVTCLSNGGAQGAERYALYIKNDVHHVNVVGGMLGNGKDPYDGSITRINTSQKGIVIEGTTGTPSDISVIGTSFPNITNAFDNRYNLIGNIGSNVYLNEYKSTANASVYATENQVISNATDTILNWGAAIYDYRGMWNASSPTRLTCKMSGYYRITANVGISANATGSRFIGTLVNGVLAKVINVPPNPVSDATIVTMSHTEKLVVGDYIQVKLFQNSGASLNILGNNYSTSLQVEMI